MSKPLALFLAGTNGSGKSSLREIKQKEVSIEIDSDKLSKLFNGNNLLGGKEAIKIFNNCLRDKISFSMETTLTGNSVLKRIEEAKHNGFSVEIKYIGLNSVEQNIQRVAFRVSRGGHDIPKDAIIKRYDESLKNLVKAVKIADRIEIIDNTEYYKLAMEIEQQKIIKFDNNANEWIHKIYKEISQELKKFHSQNQDFSF